MRSIVYEPKLTNELLTYKNVHQVNLPTGTVTNDQFDHFFNEPNGIRYAVNENWYQSFEDLTGKGIFNNRKFLILLYYVGKVENETVVLARYSVHEALRPSLKEKIDFALSVTKQIK